MVNNIFTSWCFVFRLGFFVSLLIFLFGAVAEGKLAPRKLIIRINELPSQICFAKDKFIFCNWVHHPNKIGYAIISKFGKWLRFEATTEKIENLINETKKESPTIKVEDSKTISY